MSEQEAADRVDRRPFADFGAQLPHRDALRRAITAATLRPEPDCLPPLIESARLDPDAAERARALATDLVARLRAKGPSEAVGGLMQEYDLSSEEGVALMCLAEALLRIPDAETRDALIRDKIGDQDWRSHLGHSPSLFVNAATWGLLITGKLTSTSRETSLASALARLIGKGGEPLIRAGLDLAMRLLGERFVMGRTIGEAIDRARDRERRGFRYSYDMLGEAAATASDADRYFADYQDAIEAIGAAGRGLGPIEGPGVSIKLSALHPRFVRAQRGRVLEQLAPRLLALARLARRKEVGVNIDAEEADRLELSLDLFEALAFDRELERWDGLGFVVQAYSKRAPYVIDWLVDLARRSGRRLMVRLVKGAYWDGEIKRAQTLGFADYPVFTRKIHTDVSYLACARRMLAAPDAIYPQFATHNAATLAAMREMAGADAPAAAYEFQCLHGMGEPLYEEVVGDGGLGRPCRIYAPVGSHETLLAYLVRRLLENGANSSFVNRIGDAATPIDALVADPVAAAERLTPVGRPHDAIALPRDLYGAGRANSAGLDVTDEAALEELAQALPERADRGWFAAPSLADGQRDGPRRPVRNPARLDDVVGYAIDATRADVDHAFALAVANACDWPRAAPSYRATVLSRAADVLEREAATFYGLLIREAGKTLGAAVSEVRETIDFLRYYAAGVRDWTNETHRPLGVVVAISPWNFPLAIFVGQVAAALAAGDMVLAKPAEETPLIAAEALALLRKAGLPPAALQLLPGNGEIGAALVADSRCDGVLFTGSTAAARSIQTALARRLGRDGAPVPLIAETGGINAMIVSSSALAEQVVADAIVSAFDSAGQRCSALRLLCVQEDVAGRVVAMLKGAAAELRLGDPARLETDVGPVISHDAKSAVDAYVSCAALKGALLFAAAKPEACRRGTFVAPAIVEIASVSELRREVFGPVLHVMRFRRGAIDDLVSEIEKLGHGLTFGLHTRIDETVERIRARAPAGNLYVNRNMIGAVVGVQPFGGHGMSGTGPKAGGPLYLSRLLSRRPFASGMTGEPPPAAGAFARRLELNGRNGLAARCRRLAARSPLGATLELPGPVGERNVYELRPRGTILCRATTEEALLLQICAALAVGAAAQVDAPPELMAMVTRIVRNETLAIESAQPGGRFDAALVEPAPERLLELQRDLAAREGPVVPIHIVPAAAGDDAIPLDMLVREVATSINTAAAGGNASLMALEG